MGDNCLLGRFGMRRGIASIMTKCRYNRRRTILENAMGLLTEYQHLNAAQCQTRVFSCIFPMALLCIGFSASFCYLYYYCVASLYFFFFFPGCQAPAEYPFFGSLIYFLSLISKKKKKKKTSFYWSKNIFSERLNKI